MSNEYVPQDAYQRLLAARRSVSAEELAQREADDRKEELALKIKRRGQKVY